MMQEPATRERLLAAGVEPLGLVGKEFESFLAALKVHDPRFLLTAALLPGRSHSHSHSHPFL